MVIPIKASVDLSKLRYFLIILSCFILFFSIFPVFDSGLKRYELMIGSISFLISSMFFWFISTITQMTGEGKIDKTHKLFDRLFDLSIIFWILFLIISFYFFIVSIPNN